MYNFGDIFGQHFSGGGGPSNFSLRREMVNSCYFYSHNAIPSHYTGQEGFDPCKRKFSEEELKPQPMIKKSKKIYVPDDLKDEQYWERRNKNNAAAKRSRDARRVKENQIAMRAAFLEKENGTLKSEMDKVQQENFSLKKRLMQYELEAKLNRESL